MSPADGAKDRPLNPADPVLRPGWRMLEFLLSLGADEFALRFLAAGTGADDACDRLAETLTFASLGNRVRECTVTYGEETNPRPIQVWRLNTASLAALRQIMPGGIMETSDGRRAWAEDLCVYRNGDLLLGTVTHEQYAFLRISVAEWTRFEKFR